MAELKWLEYDIFKRYNEIVNATFSRKGGVSEGKFATLNLSDRVGDNPVHVKRNRELVKEQCRVKVIVFGNQVHGFNIVEITSDNKDIIHEADGFITKEPNLALAILHADCQAAIFYDPVHEVIAAAHAGWQGMAHNIYATMVHRLKQDFKTNPKQLLIAISPSLGPENSEFRNYKKEFPIDFQRFLVKPNYFNLWEVGKYQLLKAGIEEKNVEIAHICNYMNKDEYFSHRRDKETGRNATLIARISS
jgi:YfiH family protein